MASPIVDDIQAAKKMKLDKKCVLRYAKIIEHALEPQRGSEKAAGFDLRSAYDLLVPARGKAIVKTDLQVQVPEGSYGRVAPRSGLAVKNFIDVGAGVVDEDYRGNLGVVLFNHSETDFEVKRGDRIAQFICERISIPELEQVDKLDDTERGEAGFGSTGVKELPGAKQQIVSAKTPTDNKCVLRFAKLTEHALDPQRGSERAAGLDLRSAYELKVPARGKAIVKTDLQVQLPEGSYGRVAPRSGLAVKNFIDVGAGVVDEDYRGNLGVVLFNHSDTDFEVKPGDRIAQFICERIFYPELEQVDKLDDTERGEAGFGSTGVEELPGAKQQIVSAKTPTDNKCVLRFAKLTEHALEPQRGSEKAAGLDLRSAYDQIVPARGKAIVKTDLQVQVPEGSYGRVAPRSGLAVKSFIDVGAGVVDEDYRGNLGVVLFNHSDTDFEVNRGDRIAQFICELIFYPEPKEVDKLDDTERGDAGFGSTGVKELPEAKLVKQQNSKGKTPLGENDATPIST
ncbi:uncharacterized protein dUTPase [Drosophila montana]|uniref:uncharacterized protein dUTPase n=1 Tax=Drosophila montana TaxID=40370 RepID=UPI00313B1DE9